MRGKTGYPGSLPVILPGGADAKLPAAKLRNPRHYLPGEGMA